MSKAIRAALILATVLTPVTRAEADPQGQCMLSYYRTKSSACVDEILALAGKMQPNMRGPSSNVVGFLGEVFRRAPQEKDRILAADADRVTKAVEMMALSRAGLDDDADQLAAANGLSSEYERLKAAHLATIDVAKPTAGPGENDLLIGAYSASGRPEHLARILDNHDGVNDAMAADAMRLSLLQQKFGASFAPKRRQSALAHNACEKYACKADRAKFMRLITLSTGLWAIRSVAASDDGAKAILSDFFGQRPRLAVLFKAEQNAFANYLTLLIPLMALKDDNAPGTSREVLDAMSASADAYEKLGPPDQVMRPMTKLKKQP